MTDGQDNITDTTGPVRDGQGRYDRDPTTAARDAQAAALRAQSWTYQQIGDHLGVTRAVAHASVQRALADTLEEPAAAVRELELGKLDAIERRYHDVIARRHAFLYQGADTGFDDDGPLLAAQAGLLRVTESRRKLLGLDSPTRVDVSGGVRYEVVGISTDDLT